METKPTAELRRVLQWAHEKIDAGSEPPWAWYQYMKLIETIDAIIQGTEATTTMESSRLAAERPERRLQLVDSKCPRDAAPRGHANAKVRMPV